MVNTVYYKIHVYINDGWSEILSDNQNVEDISIQIPPSQNKLKVFACGNSDFIAQMKAAKKPESQGESNTTYFELYNGNPTYITIETKVQVIPQFTPSTVIPRPTPSTVIPSTVQPGSAYNLPTFNKGSEVIQTIKEDQQWYLDKNWKDHLIHKGDKEWWVEKENDRTRFDCKIIKFDDNKDHWFGEPTTHDTPHSFRINVATTTSITKTAKVNGHDKNVGWDFDAQLEYVKSISQDHKLSWKQSHSRGYMIDDQDFKDFEATIYWQVTEWTGDKDQMTLYGRGALHPNLEPPLQPESCLAVCYKGSFDYSDGTGYFEKEYHHTKHDKKLDNKTPHGSDGYSGRLRQPISRKFVSRNFDNNWFGLKLLVYDTVETTGEQINGKDVHEVRIELWQDKNAQESIKDPAQQDWQLLNLLIDKGKEKKPHYYFEEMKTVCDSGSVRPIFSWGGPLVTFRIDNAKVNVKFASIRQILPPTNKVDVPDWYEEVDEKEHD
jgi:hypothetical protein